MIKVLIGTPPLNGSDGVQSVTGDGVNNADPKNPVLSFPDTSEVVENGNLYYTEARVSNNASVQANTAKNSYPTADANKLATIEDNAEVNTINSIITGEPTGSDQVLNVVSLTQSEYDSGTPLSNTFYVITDA
tara:strand:- start:1768 stop:2166 length:399 start_codon:yes stop_codon:yes gene_type:complete